MNKENDNTKKSRKLQRKLDEEEEDDEDSRTDEISSSVGNKSVELSSEESTQEDEEDSEENNDEEDSHDEELDEEEQEEEEEQEIEKKIEAAEPAHVDVIERALRSRNIGRPGFGKDIGILVVTSSVLGVMIYLILTLLGLTAPARPLVVPKGAVKPFFLGIHRRLIEDSYDGELRLSSNQTLSVMLLYSPYSIKSKWFREEYYNAARSMKKLHGDLAPYFGATNCFDSSSYCRSKYNLKQYPAIMAQNSAFMGSMYNGPLNSGYLIRWLNRLQNAVFRLHTLEDLTYLSKNHDLIVILYSTINIPATGFKSTTNFTKLAFHYLDGDPNTERAIFCIVTDSKFADQLQLHNEHDVVLVSSELKLLATHYKGWTIDSVYNDLKKHTKEATQQKIEFLNLGRKILSTQLAEKLKQGSVLIFFSKGIRYGDKNYRLFREIVEDYKNCPEKDVVSMENEKIDHYEDACSTSLTSIFCEANNTLSFLIVDSELESALAQNYGADIVDMVVAINAKQEITKYIRGNITRETINCLIRQHHNAADNEFVTESPDIITKKSETPEDIHSDAVGKPSLVKFVNNTSTLLTSRKINVILFSGGIWHSASSSAIAPFHLVADHFKESRTLIDFSMVDVSETSLPYNLDFDRLPKILITSAESVGLSWTYPEEFMINHTNIARFVLTRPGKIFGRLRWMDSCQGICRKRSRWELRRDRLQLKRQLSRNVANSVRQRILLGHYDRMLRMIS